MVVVVVVVAVVAVVVVGVIVRACVVVKLVVDVEAVMLLVPFDFVVAFGDVVRVAWLLLNT